MKIKIILILLIAKLFPSEFIFNSNEEGSSETIIFTLGEFSLENKENYSIIVVPPRIWFNFTSIKKISLVVNTLNQIHNKNETLKIPIK